MSFLLDKRYASMLASRMTGFQWIGHDLAMCRCPLCGDSAKNKNLKRFYIFRPTRDGIKDYLRVRCHNCSYDSKFSNFLETFDATLHGEYRIESMKEWRDTMGGSKAQDEGDFESMGRMDEHLPIGHYTRIIEGCVPLTSLPPDHYARQYIERRLIPHKQQSLLWYTDAFYSAARAFSRDEFRPFRDDARVVLPFFNEQGQLMCIQGRSLAGGDSLRYITIKYTSASPKLFGLDRINRHEPIKVVEGPIDSLFLHNCIAVGDGNLVAAPIGDIMIHDNQPRNREVCRSLMNSINRNKRVVIWPDWLKAKDINDIVKDEGIDAEELEFFIQPFIYHGLKARLAFNRWVKVSGIR